MIFNIDFYSDIITSLEEIEEAELLSLYDTHHIMNHIMKEVNITFHWVLDLEMHKWVLDQNIDYKLSMIDIETVALEIESIDDSLLFKLTWM